MSRIACTLLLAAALPVVACSKATESAGAAADLATPAGLTSTLTSKLGISEAQASQALGAILGQAKGKLSPSDYAKLSGSIPGADSYLSAAADAGIGAATEVAAAPEAPSTDSMSAAIPAAGADSAVAGATTAGADAAAAASESVGMSALNSAFSKIGIPPEAASQFVPVLTDYVGKVGGPDAANLLKGLF